MIDRSRFDRRSVLAGGVGAALLAWPAAGSAAAPGERWRRLFDGSTLDGWTFFQDGIGALDTQGVVAIENGMLHFYGPAYRGPAKAAFGHIATVDRWSNFHLRSGRASRQRTDRDDAVRDARSAFSYRNVMVRPLSDANIAGLKAGGA
jgi:hypothetical protein